MGFLSRLFDQMFDGQKEGAGHLVPGEPVPRFTLMRFLVFRCSRRGRNDEERNVMLFKRFKMVIGKGEGLCRFKHKACFFQNFSLGTKLRGFAKFQMSTREAPVTIAMRVLALSQKNMPIPVFNDNAYTNTWPLFFHKFKKIEDCNG